MVRNIDKPEDGEKLPVEQGEVGNCRPPKQYQFKPGQSGNPNGRKGSGGNSILEWLNMMQDWSTTKLRDVVENDAEPAAKKVAARIWIHAQSEMLNSGGSPIAGAEFDRIMDRTVGKPTTSIDMTNSDGSIYKALRGVSQDDL